MNPGRKVLRFLSLCFFIVSTPALAVGLNESFSSTKYREDSSLVWNISSGQLHPPFFVKDYMILATPDDENFGVGDARDGAFVRERYAEFSENGDTTGQVITLNTERFGDLQFSSFVLEAGWTLRPVGNRPLRISSQSDIIVHGEINCSGGDGASVAVSGEPVGGIGRCGGGHGGAGASSTTAAAAGGLGGEVIDDGVSAGVDGPTVGGAAAHAGTGAGGGGGGSYRERGVIPDDSESGAGGGGVRGEMAPDHNFRYIGGGFGGGGGDYGAGSSGGGGGAGGGVIYLKAVGNIDVHATGTILARGGNGGGDGANLSAGGGGGGGGGSILMFAGGDVRLAGIVSAELGMGGAAGGGGGSAGGQGADGRTWVVGVSGASQALPPHALVFEEPNTQLAYQGDTRYRTDTEFTAFSTSFDLLNTKPQLSSLVVDQDLPAGSQIAIDWATGSSAGFTPVAWRSLSQPITGERFVKFRVRVSNADETNPARLRDISVEYDPFKQTDFEFTGGCGLVHPGSFNGSSELGLALVFLPLILLSAMRILIFRR